jgi:hypothetical protein
MRPVRGSPRRRTPDSGVAAGVSAGLRLSPGVLPFTIKGLRFRSSPAPGRLWKGSHETRIAPSRSADRYSGTPSRWGVRSGISALICAARWSLSSHETNFHSRTQRKSAPHSLRSMGYEGKPITAPAPKLAALVFVRPGELRGARWSEFDLDGAEWRIPAERMKMGELHIAPLARRAVVILRELQALTGGLGFACSPSEAFNTITLINGLPALAIMKDSLRHALPKSHAVPHAAQHEWRYSRAH